MEFSGAMAGKTFHGRWAAVQTTGAGFVVATIPGPARDAAIGAAPMRHPCGPGIARAKRPVYPRCQALFWHMRTPARSNKRLSRSVPGEVNHATHPQAFRHRGSRRRLGRRDRSIRVRRRIQDDGQPGPADQRAERAAELADDERRLRLDALFQADADQPRQRQEPADGLGAGARRHAGRRAERSRERSQSAHRQRLHVHHRRLGHGLQDRRPQSRTRASSSGSPTPACSTRATRRARAASRCGKTSSSPTCPTAASSPSTATTARSSGTRRSPTKNEFGSQEQFLTAPIVAEGKVIVAERRRRRRHARLGRGARRQDRQRAVALVCRAEAGRPGQRDLEGRAQRLEDRRRRHLADRLLRSRPPSSTSSAPATRFRSTIRSSAPATTSTPTRRSRSNVDTGKLAWHFQYTPNDSWDYDEVGVHMLYDTTINGEKRKVVGHFGRNGFFYTLDRTNGRFIKAEQVRQRSELDQGHRSEDRQAARIRPEARRADLQPRGARAARRRHEARPARPGTAASRTSRSRSTRSRTSPTASAPKAASRRTAPRSRRWSPDGGIDDEDERAAQVHAAISTTARSPPSTPSTTRCIAKAVTDIEIRSGATGHRRRPGVHARCRTAGSSPTTTRRSRSSGASTSARRSRARR